MSNNNLMNYDQVWAQEMRNICSNIGFNNPLMAKRMFYYQGVTIQGEEVDYSKKDSFAVLKEAIKEQNKFAISKFNNLIKSGSEKNSEFKMRLAAAYASIIRKQIAREQIIWREIHRTSNLDAKNSLFDEYEILTKKINEFFPLTADFISDDETPDKFKEYLRVADAFLERIIKQNFNQEGDKVPEKLFNVNLLQTFIISGEAYHYLKNPVGAYFSRRQLIGDMIKTDIDYTEIADRFFNETLKKERNKENQVTYLLSQEFASALEDGIIKMLHSSNGSKIKFRQAKRTTVKSKGNKSHLTEKKAFEEIIKQYYWMPLLKDLQENEERTFEFNIKIDGISKKVKGVFNLEKFELRNMDETIIMRIGQQDFSLMQQVENIANKKYKKMGEFATVLYLAIEQGLIKSMNNNSFIFKEANEDQRDKFLQWYRKDARIFFTKMFKDNDKAAKIYNNAQLSGILGEINTAIIAYFKFGFAGKGKGTYLLAAAGKNVDVKKTVSNLKGGAGFQSKNRISEEKSIVSEMGSVGPYVRESMKIYGDTQISFMSTNALSNYFGEDFAHIVQYFLVNRIPQQEILKQEPISFKELGEDIERMAFLRIPSFLRYNLIGENSINDFYILNGRLIPASIIIYLAYRQAVNSWDDEETRKKIVTINLKNPSEGYKEYFMERKLIEPNEMKNLVNAEILKSSKIKYTGLNVKFNVDSLFN